MIAYQKECSYFLKQFTAFHPAFSKSCQQKDSHNESRNSRDIIAIFNVKSNALIGAKLLTNNCLFPIRCGLKHIATLVNKSRDAGISRTGDATAGFYGAQYGKVEVLAVAGCVSPPAVVGDDYKQVCTITHKSAYKLTKN